MGIVLCVSNYFMRIVIAHAYLIIMCGVDCWYCKSFLKLYIGCLFEHNEWRDTLRRWFDRPKWKVTTHCFLLTLIGAVDPINSVNLSDVCKLMLKSWLFDIMSSVILSELSITSLSSLAEEEFFYWRRTQDRNLNYLCILIMALFNSSTLSNSDSYSVDIVSPYPVHYIVTFLTFRLVPLCLPEIRQQLSSCMVWL